MTLPMMEMPGSHEGEPEGTHVHEEHDQAPDGNESKETMEPLCDVCSAYGEKKEAQHLDIESKGINLCSQHAVEYQGQWRLEHARVEPNILGYISWVRGRIRAAQQQNTQ